MLSPAADLLGAGVGEAVVVVADGLLAGEFVVDVGLGAGLFTGLLVVGGVPGFLVVLCVLDEVWVVPLRDVVRVVVVRVVVVPPSLDRFVVTVVCECELG